MGHVYRAWDGRLHREVAIKVLNREFVMPGMRERFLREARAASALTHPNICTIFDIGEQDGNPYLVMELLQGSNLKDRILDRSMPIEEIITIARDTAEALGAAHSKGVVHRDVKPANIFLIEKPNGGIQAKVLDFGLAKINGGVLGGRTRNQDITTAGATVGTLAYMSPEQARGEPLDARSDLFSLGVVMYEMATRHVPFQGATSALVFVQLLNHDPESVRDWNEQIPRELEKIIFKLLSKDPAARYQSANELELALLAINDRAGGFGWLRRAAASVPLVPLVRAADPVARERRPTRPIQASGPHSRAFEISPQPVAPLPPTTSDQTTRRRVAEGDLIRPVQRIPRTDRASQTPAPGSRLTDPFTPVPSTSARSHQVPAPQPSVVSNQHATPKQDAIAPLTPIPESPISSPDHPFANPTSVLAQPEQLLATFSRGFTTPPRTRKRLSLFWLLVSICVGLIVALAIFLFIEPRPVPAPVLHRGDIVAMTQIENRTGNTTLDDSVTDALAAQLSDSSFFILLSGPSYQSARRLMATTTPSISPSPQPEQTEHARRIAERMGASAFLSGFISSTHGAYFIHLDLRTVADNRIISALDEHADSLAQLPPAIEALALDLRSAIGETRAQLDLANFSLDQQFSSNLAAVQPYAESDLLLTQHQLAAAIPLLENAIALDPKFVAARLRLTSIERDLRAETAAADSARMAFVAADGAAQPVRRIAEATYEMEANGNLPRAIEILQQILQANPHDASAQISLAHALNLQGRMTEALSFAQQAYAHDPFHADAYAEAEFALIGLDRFDAAAQLDAQAQRLGIARPQDTITAAYLTGHLQSVDTQLGNLPAIADAFTPDAEFANTLDNQGRLPAGRALWISRAKAANANRTLRSAAAFLYAQAGLNRALLGQCNDALAILHDADHDPSLPFGPIALSHVGLARALCGDLAGATKITIALQQRYPQNLRLIQSSLPQIQAAIALARANPANAVNDLPITTSTALTPLLLARANLDLHQTSPAIADLQAALAHRGTAFLFAGDVYPAAQIQLARAFADSGDIGNSAQTYRTFLSLWSVADQDQPLLKEARLHAQP